MPRRRPAPRAGWPRSAGRAAGRRGRASACPRRRRRPSARPRAACWGAWRPERLGVVVVLVLGIVSVALNVVGPVVLGRATDVIFAGVLGRQLPAGLTTAQAAARRPRRRRRHHGDADRVAGRRARARASTSPRSAGCCCSSSRSTSAASLLAYLQGWLLNGIVQRTIATLRRDVEDKLHRLPLGYVDAPAARRAAQPGHQRHRQRLAEPAADDEPAADVAPDGGRRARR